MGADEDNDEPLQENSGEFENEPSDADNKFNANVDDVEGTKNFDRAYDKLIKKFYHEEGANLLIPQEDMVMHEYNLQNKVKVNVDEQQRKIREM